MNAGMEYLQRLTRTYWHRWEGLAAAIGLVLLSSSAAAANTQGNALVVVTVLALVAVIAIATSWWRYVRLPSFKDGVSGILVDIKCADGAIEKQLEQDFIYRLRELVESGQFRAHTALSVLKAPHSGTISSERDAELVGSKTNATLVIYGQARTRTTKGKKLHVLDLRAMVRHAKISESDSSAFGADIGQILPSRIETNDEAGLKTFEVTAEFVDLACRYIVATADLFALKLDNAERAYRELEKRLKARVDAGREDPITTGLCRKLADRFANITMARAAQEYIGWRGDRDTKRLERIRKLIRALPPARQKVPNACTLDAIAIFAADRTPTIALKRMREGWDGRVEMHLGAAFLEAYQGNLKASSSHYRAAAAQQPLPATIAEVREFLEWIESTEPNSAKAVAYCRAFLSYAIERNKRAAEREFGRYLSLAPADERARSVALVEKWLREMR